MIDLFVGWPAATYISFAICTIIILFVGVRITRLADALGKRTGIGSALFGAVLLGGTTSLPGIITSVSTAWQGYADLAVSNAVGGIAAQTTFLIFADMIYRRANLEHAAASLENLVQCTLLIALLSIALVGLTGPDVTIFAIHPVSIILLLSYGFGLRLISDTQHQPLWFASKTKETKPESETSIPEGKLSILWWKFSGYAVAIAFAGYGIGETGIAIARITGLSETVVGTLFTSVATSLPELVTVLFAVRMGALTLAVGDIIGGNSFDVLFLAFSDFAYQDGSIYHATTQDTAFILTINLLMSTVLLLGLLRRKRNGIGNIGFEGFMVLILYALAVVVVTS
ncbi:MULTISPECIES: sodium:calcium antiporter [unclassified Methylophaga]|jgi:cation:H+ antiporter|uniref:sodium:calcium antiporter n=2 Tax=Methylophaga TaxID=40222 RepID=UPI00259CF425|nr:MULTISPECIES: sodium:calcium antiporter [unclassified Methylophaga]|tara:strand:+ start:18400 stop:19425 length:1026 start_codon:yes stop_codon:yes gene_type:complete